MMGITSPGKPVDALAYTAVRCAGGAESAPSHADRNDRGALGVFYRAFLVMSLIVFGSVGLMPRHAAAHAVVLRASVRDADLQAFTAAPLVLRFNARIETGLAQVTLIDEAGTEQELEVGRGENDQQLAITLPALPPGHYALRYKVLAGDGHITEDTVRFELREPGVDEH